MNRSPEDSRRSPRSKVLLSAVLEWSDRSFSVVLRDLSEHGALVETGEAMEMGGRLYFCRNELRVPGQVAWAQGRLAGIAFGRPLKADVVLRHIKRPVVRAAADNGLFRRPGFNRLGMVKEWPGTSD